MRGNQVCGDGMATRDGFGTEGDLPEGRQDGVHARQRAEEPIGQESEGPYEQRNTCNGCRAQGPRKVEGGKTMTSEVTPGHHWPRTKSVNKLKDTLRAKTRRTNGQALAVIIADVNRTLRGWFVYFQHSPRHWFRTLDSWLRTRLRSILRRRQHRRGRSDGRDHQRWPNAFFAAHGLFDLTTTRAHAGQSA
jgi:hypothetical protein